MSKPRWIDGGVFRALRTATRNRTLTVIAGPALGSAEVSCRADLRTALGDGDRSALGDDARLKSGPDEGLRAAWTLRQPGLVTTSVSDAVLASAPDDLESPPRVFGPGSKGLASAYSRKDPFVVHLCGSAAGPDTLVLTQKDRKALLKPDSRYQVFLRKTFGRDVLFAGFSLGDPDLVELLDDVGRVFNGHCPHNVALVQAGSSDPAAALRASMHYGMTVIEYPSGMTASQALAELATVLEELEVPKPATGDPPRGYTEIDQAARDAVPAGDEAGTVAFHLGDSSSWSPIRDGLDVPRSVMASIQAAVVADAPEGKVPVVLVKGRSGQGKTVLARRLAWELSSASPRTFWREPGVSAPDRYVPAEAEDFRAVFVCDDAHQLETLPLFLKQLAREAGGKARLVLVADGEAWDRSGLDHRIRQDAAVVDLSLDGIDADEAAAFEQSLSAAGRVAGGADVAAILGDAETTLLDGLFQITRGHGLVGAGAAAAASLADQPVAHRGLLAVAFVHQYGLSLDGGQLARVTEVAEAELDQKVVAAAAPWIVRTAAGAVRTPHPAVAQALVAALAPAEEARHEMTLALLRTLSGATAEEPGVFDAPSELIRAVRHGPLPPLVLASFFEAGEPAARNDVWFWFDRGRAEADFSRWDAALAAFDQALWRRPEEAREKEHNALVQANRARCLQALGKKREALAATEEGLRALPQDAGLLRLHEKLGGRRRGGNTGGPRGRGGERRGGGAAGGRGGPGGGPGGRGRGGPGGGRGAGGGPQGGRGAPARPGA